LADNLFMQVTPLDIPDVLLLTPKKFGDHRGFFSETYSRKAMKELAGIDFREPLNHPSDHDYYEDVLLESAAHEADTGPVVQVSRADAETCLRGIDPVLRLSTLFRRDEDFLTTIAAHATARWPGRDTFGLVELFHATQPIWQEYTEFCLASSQAADGWRATCGVRRGEETYRAPRCQDAPRTRSIPPTMSRLRRVP